MIGLILLALCWKYSLSPWLWFMAGMMLMEKLCAKDDDS
jgi:hypothetical protein